MQKIVEQQLGGIEEEAKVNAEFTWKEGEVAWYFCWIYRDVFKVQFTGKHWLVGNHWSRDKIYQYRYIDSSNNENHERKLDPYSEDNLSQGSENLFYTERSEAIERAFRYLNNTKQDFLRDWDRDVNKINEFKNQPLPV